MHVNSVRLHTENDFSDNLCGLEVCIKLLTCHTQHHQATQYFACLPSWNCNSREVLIKTLLRNRTRDVNLAKLMRFKVEGPDLKSVDLQPILDILNGKKSADSNSYLSIKPYNVNIFLKILGGGGGAGDFRATLPLCDTMLVSITSTYCIKQIERVCYCRKLDIG